MANTFKNYFAGAVGTTTVNVYTVPAATQATVIGMSIANLNTSAIAANVTVFNSASSNSLFMVKQATIASGGALVPIGGDQKLVLEAGDKLQVQMDGGSSADVIVSVLEIT
jgi:hypothetical protein